MKMEELENKLRQHSQVMQKTVPSPFNLQEMMQKMEGQTMQKSKNKITKWALVAAALVLCVTAVGVTPLADPIKGYFKDVVRWDGAITGTEYKNATDEMKLEVAPLNSSASTSLSLLTVTAVDKTAAPYAFIEELAVASYKILSADGKEVFHKKFEAEDAPKGKWEEGTASIYLAVDKEDIGGTTILIDGFYGLSKADAPLTIYGSWSFEQ